MPVGPTNVSNTLESTQCHLKTGQRISDLVVVVVVVSLLVDVVATVDTVVVEPQCATKSVDNKIVKYITVIGNICFSIKNLDFDNRADVVMEVM